jgi:hypothetical protein
MLPLAVAPAPRAPESIDRVVWEVEAALGPSPPAADGPGPQEVAPPANGVVATPRPLAAAMLGPLVAPGSHFLELLVVADVWSFNSLRLPDAVRRVVYAPGVASGEIALGEQSRPDLFWPVDILLGAGGNAIASVSTTTSSSASSWGRWRPRCGSSPPPASATPTPSPRRSEGEILAR